MIDIIYATDLYVVNASEPWKEDVVIPTSPRWVEVEMGVRPNICFYCNKRLGIKADSRGHLICKACLTTQTVVVKPGPSRNDFCPCGSGMKYKRCCRKVLVT